MTPLDKIICIAPLFLDESRGSLSVLYSVPFVALLPFFALSLVAAPLPLASVLSSSVRCSKKIYIFMQIYVTYNLDGEYFTCHDLEVLVCSL